MAIYAEPASLNPLLAGGSQGSILDDLTFDGLVTVDHFGTTIPDLALRVPSLRNGDISRDGRAIRYVLRKNVRWQDGVPFTSADVKFSWLAVMNPRNNVVTRTAFDDVTRVDTPSPSMVVFHLKRPYAPFVDLVFSEGGLYPILPAHLLARYRDLNHVDFNEHPIGTGPFRVVRWARGDYADYEANAHYFLGKPKLHQIRVYFIPDANTVNNLIRTHEIDLAPDLGAAHYRLLQGIPGFRRLQLPAPIIFSLVMNVSRPALKDVRVRRAMAYAIDKRRILYDFASATGEIATANIARYYRWAYDPNLRTYDYNVRKADRLLDDAGWRRGPNGIRVKLGAPLSLEIVLGSGGPIAPQLLVVQTELREIGIDAPIKRYPADLLYGTSPQTILRNGNFDIAPSVSTMGADPDDSLQWLCREAAPAGVNLTRYCNPRLDAFENVALEHYDRATRRRAYQKIQEILAADVPAIFIYYRRRLSMVSTDLRDYEPSALPLGWGAYRWSW